MGQLVASMKIYPKEVIGDFSMMQDAIKKILPKDSYVYKFEEEPIAFGLKALIAHVVMDEATAGEMEKVEAGIKTIPEVDEVEVLLVRRI
jgi:elongation factor 1-beta